MTVLLVEDHRELAQWLATELRHAGWAPEIASTAADARHRVRQRSYDVLLVDIGLPDGDGIALCRDLRAMTDAPLLMVTARQDVEDRVRALDSGADDYLAKPFAVDELLARMRAIRRRHHHDDGPILECGPLRVWVEERRAEVAGAPLALSRREFDLLAVLMRHPGRVYTREALLEAAWGYDFYGESNVVDVTVRRLRGRIAEAAGIELEAVRGVGYRLASPPPP